MPSVNRRNFLKVSGLTVLPALIPAGSLFANSTKNESTLTEDNIIRLHGDGIMYEPTQYIEQLQLFNDKQNIEKDRYGTGGAVAALEKRFEKISGKEKAVFIPTGTMANQLAIAVLSGEKTKVFVQDTSHVYRDEADAAQAIFQKRLMPLAKDETYFTADELKNAIESLQSQEVFQSGIGAVSIENPVRRSDGRSVPIEEIKKISTYCRNNNIKLHLDGARIYMASAWSGISIKEYASYFDTIYISLYKYLGASGGAILCGDNDVMKKIPHLIKIHGGSMYGNWTNAAMALHRLEGLENRLKQSKERADEVFTSINKSASIKIKPLEGGTNIYSLDLAKDINANKFQEIMGKEYNIRMGRADDKNRIMIAVNETLLFRDMPYVINAFQESLKVSKV